MKLIQCSTLARAVFAVTLLTTAAATVLVPTQACAQARQRTIDGTVRNGSGQPLPNAVVYLKNVTSLSVKTYVTDANGNYRFGQVPMDADYQVYAESAGKKSNTKTISNFDSKLQWTVALKIDK
jgi:protocatechuate 3,4-dioxygenase beta subunit